VKLPRLLAEGRTLMLARLVGNGFAQALVAVATLLLTSAVFDRLMTGGDIAVLVWAAGAWLCLAAVAFGLVTLERIDAETLGQSYARAVRLVLFDRVTRLAPRALQKHSRGSVLLRFVGDLTSLRQWLSHGLARLAVTGVVVVGTLGALMLISLAMALSVAAVLLCGTALSAAAGRPLALALLEARRRSSRLAANVSERIASMPVVQVHHQARRERKRLERQGRKLEHASVVRSRWIGVLRAIGDATGRIATGAVLLIGALQVQSGATTAGTVLAAAAVVGFLSPSIRDLGRAFEAWSKARVARGKLEAFLRADDGVRQAGGALKLAAGAGELRFEHVSFGALRDFDATVPGGRRVAIVGANGVGKTTLLWLAARLMDPDAGRVLFDGQDLKQVNLGSLRRAIGVVAPGLPLLRGTVAANISYRWPAASAADVARACAASGLDAVLGDWPSGLETKLVDQGANLSEGERRRVALARALLGEPRLLLLDEIESNLDPRSRVAIEAALRAYSGTVLFATHDLAWVRAADIVWHVADGRLTESGTPDEVLRAAGPTSALFGMRAVG
jgi:ATP-binding cassette subfamily B protein